MPGEGLVDPNHLAERSEFPVLKTVTQNVSIPMFWPRMQEVMGEQYTDFAPIFKNVF